MSKKDDGGPAFPLGHIYRRETNMPPDIGFEGMSLRDWFAGQALAGFRSQYGLAAFSHELMAARSYAAADAMIKERNKNSDD